MNVSRWPAVVIIVLLGVVVVLAIRVIELENFHYASSVGLCGEFRGGGPEMQEQYHRCLHASQTRTTPLWHLFYALIGD